jgi:hypothetical protein
MTCQIISSFTIIIGLTTLCKCQSSISKTVCEKINSPLTLVCGNRLQWYKNDILINKGGTVDEKYFIYETNSSSDSLTIKNLNISDNLAVYYAMFANERCSFQIKLYGKHV